jgi:WD40 repeat protein/predicted Ser/Thr protein kinase
MKEQDAAILLLQAAAARGMLTTAQVETWIARLDEMPQGQGAQEWLIERGVLRAEQIAQLRMSLSTVPRPPAGVTGPGLLQDVLPAAADRAPLIPGYQLIELIATGGMGVVYKAIQEQPRRVVAIKVLRGCWVASEEQRRRFEREAQAVADLSHPGIVAIYGFGQIEGRSYFSMEYVDGKPLDKYVQDQHLGMTDKLILMQRVCEAVAYAHQRGVIHRDLKPGNILVTDEGRPKVLDFGLAKLSEAADRDMLRTLTLDGQILGTVPYMAPEQTLGRPGEIDVRTDVYALGVILYELVTGRLPHEPGDMPALEVMRRIREEPPRPPSSVSRAIDDEVEAIILKALEKDKEQRYRGADAFGQDIGHYLSDEPIQAKRASLAYQLRKLARRHRAVLIPAAAAVAAVIIAIGLAFVRVRAERNVAVAARIEADRQRDIALKARSEAETAREAETQQRRAAEEAQKMAEREKETAVRAREDAEKAREGEARQRRAFEQQAYFSVIALAQKHLEELSYDQAEALLDRCPPRLRQWEWFRLKLLCHPETLTWNQRAPVTSVAVSQDGTMIAVAASREVSVRDLRNDSKSTFLGEFPAAVTTLGFSADGGRLVCGCEEGSASSIDLRSPGTTQIVKGGRLLPGQAYPVRLLAVSPDGKYFAASADGQTVELRQSGTGELIGAMVIGSEVQPEALLFSPDSAYLISSGERSGRLWDLKTGLGVALQPLGVEDPAMIAFNPQGRSLVLCDSDEISVRTLDDRRELWQARPNYRGVDDPMAFSATGKLLAATTHWPGRVLIWEADSGQQAMELSLGEAHADCLAWDSRDDTLAVALDDGTIRLLDVKGQRELRRLEVSPRKNGGRTDFLAFSAHDKLVVAGMRDEDALCVWDAETGKERRRWEAQRPHRGMVALSPDGMRVASVRGRDLLVLTDPQEEQEVFTIRTDNSSISGLAYSPDAQQLACAGSDGCVRVLQSATGQEILRLRGDRSDIACLAFSPDGKFLATADPSGRVRLWDAQGGEERWGSAGHNCLDVMCLGLGPDGKLIASAGEDKTVRVWDAGTGRQLHVFLGHEHWVTSLAFDQGGARLASGGRDGNVIVWDTQAGKEVLRIAAHKGAVHSISFAPDGFTVVSAGEDRAVRLWDLSTGRMVAALKGHSAEVRAVACNPRRTQIVSGSMDHTVKVWESADLAQPFFLHRLPPVAVSARGEHVATASSMGLCLWDVDARAQARLMPWPAGPPTALAFSLEGSRIAGATSLGHVCVWDRATARLLFSAQDERGRSIDRLLLSADARKLVTTGLNGEVTVREPDTGRTIRDLPATVGVNDSLALSHGGEYVATVDRDSVNLLAVEVEGQARILLDLKEAVTTPPQALLAFGTTKIRGVDPEFVELKDPESGLPHLLMKPRIGGILPLVFSPSGARLAFGDRKGVVYLFDIEADGRPLRLPEVHKADVLCLAFSLDARWLASGARDGTVALWDVTERKWLRTQAAYSRPVVAIALSPDGARVVACSDDGSLKLWDRPTGQELMTLEQGLGLVTSLFFGDDGRRLVCVTWDGTVRIWDAGPSFALPTEQG